MFPGRSDSASRMISSISFPARWRPRCRRSRSAWKKFCLVHLRLRLCAVADEDDTRFLLVVPGQEQVQQDEEALGQVLARSSIEPETSITQKAAPAWTAPARETRLPELRVQRIEERAQRESWPSGASIRSSKVGLVPQARPRPSRPALPAAASASLGLAQLLASCRPLKHDAPSQSTRASRRTMLQVAGRASLTRSRRGAALVQRDPRPKLRASQVRQGQGRRRRPA